jgi:hypothetical protein
MRVRVADLTQFNEEIEVRQGCTIAELKSIVSDRFSFDTSDCSVFTEDQRCLADSDAIPSDSCPFLVFYSRKIYRDKAFPAIEDAFQFPSTRFGRFSVRPSDNFPDDGRRRAFFDFGDRIIRTGLPSGSSDSDDDGPYDPDLDQEELHRRIQGIRGMPLLLSAAAREGIPGEAYVEQFLDSFHDESDEGEQTVQVGALPLEGATIVLNAEDIEPVRRLAGLGFSPGIVAQVYEACGRDEAVTQQCLLSGGFR